MSNHTKKKLYRIIPVEEPPAPTASANPDCHHKDDYSTVWWYGETFWFTPQEAAAVRCLWEEWERSPHLPDVRQTEVLKAAKSGEPQLRRLFRDNPAWGRMIFPSVDFGGKVGYYRLAPPPGRRGEVGGSAAGSADEFDAA